MDPDKIVADLNEHMAALQANLDAAIAKSGTTEELVTKQAETICSLNEGIDNLKTAVVALQATANRPDVTGSGSGEIKSLGELMIQSTQYKSAMEDGVREVKSIDIEGGFGHRFKSRYTKSITSTTGPDVPAQRVPEYSLVRQETPRIRDLINVLTTSSSSIEFVKETRFNQISSTVATEAASGQADIIVANINGFVPTSTITIDPAAVGTTETATVSSVTAATEGSPGGTITVTVNLTNTHAVGIEVVSDEFQFTPETTLKPMANAVFSLESASVKTLAHWIPASRQILEDASQLKAYIDMRLLEGLMLAEEKQILYGDGTGNQLDGIIADSDTQTYSWSDGTVGDTKLDAIRRAMTLAALAHYPVDGIILHPTDWEEIELAKGTDGHYLFQSAPGSTAAPTIWGVPVVTTTQIDSGTALLGAFRIGVALWDRMRSAIRVAEQHASFFVENMVAVLAEERIALTLMRPESFVAVTFDNAPTP